MKKNYEIALLQHVHGSVEDDYETVIFVCKGGCSYNECRTVAKELSKHIGEVRVQGVGYTFNGRTPDNDFPQQRLDAGLTAVKIVCYTETDYTSYEPLYYEYYKDGKKDYKISF